MFPIFRFSVCATALFVSASANAAIIDVTGATLKAAFATVRDGDTLRVTGPVAETYLQNRIFAKQVTIDATKATFTSTLGIVNVSNLRIVGGTFGSKTVDLRSGRALAISDSRNISLSRNIFVGTGGGEGIGVMVARSTSIGISAASFQKLKLGLAIVTSEKVRVSSSHFIGMTKDGINIVDSHFVTATTNRCFNGAPSVGAHPDCIQLWSLSGQPVQSDITLINNIVTGPTQGLTSFDEAKGGGLRISILNNNVSTSYPQGIACYGCVDSIITGNVLTTLPGSNWRTSLNVVGGSNNIVANNSIGAKPVATSAFRLAAFDIADSAVDPLAAASANFSEPLPDFDFNDPALLGIGGIVSDKNFNAGNFSTASGNVPEPMLWAQLLIGFALTGAAARRMQRQRAAWAS